MPEKLKEIKIEMPTSVYQAANLRDLVFAVAHNIGQFSERWSYRLQAVADELCSNAIEHGSAKDDTLRVILQIIPKEELTIIVEDNGKGAVGTSAAELNKHVADQEDESGSGNAARLSTTLRGRGLAKIVKTWTDKISFEDRTEGGIRVTASKKVASAVAEEKGNSMTETANTDTIAKINFR